jgi:FKBP-type peptidyl-prolyl cis-trans isomerase 2
MKVENGNKVSVHYRGTLSNGTEFDSSYTRGEPIEFEVGSGQMISGFESAIPGMEIGEKKNITIDSDNAYGSRDEEAIQSIPKGAFPPDFEFVEGATVQGQSPGGKPFLAKICEAGTETVTLDFNHPLAGEDLTFEIELLNIN